MCNGKEVFLLIERQRSIDPHANLYRSLCVWAVCFDWPIDWTSATLSALSFLLRAQQKCDTSVDRLCLEHYIDSCQLYTWTWLQQFSCCRPVVDKNYVKSQIIKIWSQCFSTSKPCSHSGSLWISITIRIRHFSWEWHSSTDFRSGRTNFRCLFPEVKHYFLMLCDWQLEHFKLLRWTWNFDFF